MVQLEGSGHYDNYPSSTEGNDMWIDTWRGVPTRRMVLGLFMGNALADMYAQCGKCEVVNTSSICFPGDTNVGLIAKILG